MDDRYLFKAKRIDNGEWVQGALVYDDRDKLYRIITEIDYSTGTCVTADKAPRIKKSTICKCSELEDDHGTMIFENDVLCLTNKANGSKRIAVIKFGNHGTGYSWDWYLVPAGTHDVITEIFLWIETTSSVKDCEVIGNVLDDDLCE